MTTIELITVDTEDWYSLLVKLICYIRGIPVPFGTHCRLILGGLVYELAANGITQQSTQYHAEENIDAIIDRVRFGVDFPDLVIDRISTLAMANQRLWWWPVLRVLLTGKSDAMFCTDLPLIVLGLGRGERPLTPDELVVRIIDTYDAVGISEPHGEFL